jgi:hypothetical protein
MKRKRPLKRTGYLKRNKPLRWQSPERKELRKKVSPMEQEILAQFDTCVYCQERPATCIDHIAGGASRHKALSERCACNASCLECNLGDANDPTKFPLFRKLAVKLVTDGEFFDLEKFNRLRGRAPNAITLADITAFLDWR